MPSKYKTFAKVHRIVSSCKTAAQRRIAQRVVDRFHYRYNDAFLLKKLDQIQLQEWYFDNANLRGANFELS